MPINSEKGYSPLLIPIIIVILVLGGVFYFRTQNNGVNNSELSNFKLTEDLKTYTNEKYNYTYTFEYPSDYKVIDATEEKDVISFAGLLPEDKGNVFL